MTALGVHFVDASVRFAAFAKKTFIYKGFLANRVMPLGKNRGI